MECRKNKIMEALDLKTKVSAEVQACFDALKKRTDGKVVKSNSGPMEGQVLFVQRELSHINGAVSFSEAVAGKVCVEGMFWPEKAWLKQMRNNKEDHWSDYMDLADEIFSDMELLSSTTHSGGFTFGMELIDDTKKAIAYMDKLLDRMHVFLTELVKRGLVK